MNKKGHIHGMECEGVDGPYMIDVVDGLSVALECVFLLLNLGAWVKVLHSDAPLDRSGRITCADTAHGYISLPKMEIGMDTYPVRRACTQAHES